jgi:hypothetical protein
VDLEDLVVTEDMVDLVDIEEVMADTVDTEGVMVDTADMEDIEEVMEDMEDMEDTVDTVDTVDMGAMVDTEVMEGTDVKNSRSIGFSSSEIVYINFWFRNFIYIRVKNMV